MADGAAGEQPVNADELLAALGAGWVLRDDGDCAEPDSHMLLRGDEDDYFFVHLCGPKHWGGEGDLFVVGHDQASGLCEASTGEPFQMQREYECYSVEAALAVVTLLAAAAAIAGGAKVYGPDDEPLTAAKYGPNVAIHYPESGDVAFLIAKPEARALGIDLLRAAAEAEGSGE